MNTPTVTSTPYMLKIWRHPTSDQIFKRTHYFINQVEEEIFIKYFTGAISPKEETELLEWIDASDENRKEYMQQRKVWDMYLLHRVPEEPAVSFGQILVRHNRKLTRNTTVNTSDSNTWVSQLLKFAAIFVIAFGLAWYVFDNREQTPLYNTVEVPSGQRVKLTLPDGSLVWLNAQTKFTYPAVFDKRVRSVTLDGEGLFEIVHNEKHPFTVQTPKYEVKVLGTTFDVYAYSNSNSFETILIEGSVAVTDGLSGKVYQVQPGCKLFFDDHTQQMRMVNVNPDEYTSWKDGIYIFNDITFAEMAKRLEHYYKTKIIITDSLLMNYHCTGKFRQYESITDIMDVVKSDAPFKYSYNKDANELIIERKNKK